LDHGEVVLQGKMRDVLNAYHGHLTASA